MKTARYMTAIRNRSLSVDDAAANRGERAATQIIDIVNAIVTAAVTFMTYSRLALIFNDPATRQKYTKKAA